MTIVVATIYDHPRLIEISLIKDEEETQAKRQAELQEVRTRASIAASGARLHVYYSVLVHRLTWTLRLHPIAVHCTTVQSKGRGAGS